MILLLIQCQRQVIQTKKYHQLVDIVFIYTNRLALALIALGTPLQLKVHRFIQLMSNFRFKALQKFWFHINGWPQRFFFFHIKNVDFMRMPDCRDSHFLWETVKCWFLINAKVQRCWYRALKNHYRVDNYQINEQPRRCTFFT